MQGCIIPTVSLLTLLPADVARAAAPTIKGDPQVVQMTIAQGTRSTEMIEIQTERGPLTIDYIDFNAPITINDPPC